MNNNSLYSEFASRFAEASIDSLINSFNAQVGNRGFNSARAAHDTALHCEFMHRGIDTSAVVSHRDASFVSSCHPAPAVSSIPSISFANKVRLQDNALVII